LDISTEKHEESKGSYFEKFFHQGFRIPRNYGGKVSTVKWAENVKSWM